MKLNSGKITFAKKANWLTTVLISALIGQCNWTVRVIAGAFECFVVFRLLAVRISLKSV